MAAGIISLQISGSATPQGDNAGGGGFRVDWSQRFTDGYSSGEADRVAFDRRSLAASGSETIDLRALTDASGNSTSTVAEIRGFGIRIPPRTLAGAANASGLTFKAASSNGNLSMINGTTDALIVTRGGFALFTFPNDGLNTVSGSLKGITVANTDSVNALEFELVYFLASA
jgi:hypothetical protein